MAKKFDINKLTLWVGFLTNPTEEEIQEAANKMKNGRAYLFKDEGGDLYLYNMRRLNEYAARGKTFVRKITPT